MSNEDAAAMVVECQRFLRDFGRLFPLDVSVAVTIVESRRCTRFPCPRSDRVDFFQPSHLVAEFKDDLKEYTPERRKAFFEYGTERLRPHEIPDELHRLHSELMTVCSVFEIESATEDDCDTVSKWFHEQTGEPVPSVIDGGWEYDIKYCCEGSAKHPDRFVSA